MVQCRFLIAHRFAPNELIRVVVSNMKIIGETGNIA